MTSLTPPPASSLYDVGLFMIIVYAFTLVRSERNDNRVGISAITLAVYPLAALAVHQTRVAFVATNVGFLLGMIVLGFVSSYSMGRYSRSNFLQRPLICSAPTSWSEGANARADHEERPARCIARREHPHPRSVPNRSSQRCPRRCPVTSWTRSTALRKRSAPEDSEPCIAANRFPPPSSRHRGFPPRSRAGRHRESGALPCRGHSQPVVSIIRTPFRFSTSTCPPAVSRIW